jgi:hypothetical protein
VQHGRVVPDCGDPSPYAADVAVREIPNGPPEAFLGAVAGLRAVMQKGLRAEVGIEEVPAPQRIAPYAMALSADVVSDGDDLATGRFILLYDPASPDAWQGPFRIVSYVRAALESELATDPMLGQVGWSWLQDALGSEQTAHHAVGGTVTRVVSETFGELAGPPPTVELEIRASWTPSTGGPGTDPGPALGEHLLAWSGLLCAVAGLPPLPPGVTALPRLR